MDIATDSGEQSSGLRSAAEPAQAAPTAARSFGWARGRARGRPVQRRPRMRDASVKVAGTVLVLAVVVLVWQALVATGVLSYETIPTPLEAFGALVDMVVDGSLWPPLGHSLTIFLVSFVLAAVIGIVLGVIVGLSRTAYLYTKPTLEFLRFIPPPAIIPLVLLITGFTDQSEVIIATFASVWLVFLNTIDGVRLLTPELREVGRSVEMSRWQMLYKLILPSAMPLIAVGLRLALSLCLIIVITTEIIAVRAGLGFALTSASSSLQPGRVYALTFVVGLLGLLLNYAFKQAEDRVRARREGM